MKLRGQLLLAALLVALLPLTALLFLNPIERLLRAGHEQAVAETAASAAALLESRVRLAHDPTPRGEAPVLYLHPSDGARLLDGYADDWQGRLDRVIGLDGGEVSDRSAEALDDGIDPVRIAALDDGAAIALYIRARDSTPAFAGAGGRSGDAVRIGLGTGGMLVFAPAAPGPIVLRDAAGRLVRGHWQDRVDGWSLEVRLPRSPGVDTMRIAIIDGDAGGAIVGQHLADRLRLVQRDAALDDALNELGGGPAWVVDGEGWVLGRSAPDLEIAPAPERPPGAFDFLMAARLDDAPAWSGVRARLSGPELEAAFAGDPSTGWWRVGGERSIRLRHARPVELHGVGHALVLERDAGPLLLVANRAVLSWLGASLAVFMAVALLLFGFALVLSFRIRRLRNAAEHAVERGGRVGTLPQASAASDEIGDLSRSLRELLERQREHQRYLQTLADKLAHELRTPVTMVQSSLENLAAHRDERRDEGGEEGPDARPDDRQDNRPDDRRADDYLRRAGQGAQRLRRIVQAMSQAARLEDSLTGEVRRPLDLAGLIADYVEARRDAVQRSGRSLDFEAPARRGARIEGSEDLLAQLLDKIVDNALDFTPAGGRISLLLSPRGTGWRLTVENDGPRIDAEQRSAMFDSMVSWRRSSDDAPHLGLGLYVARCIVEYHGGRIDARPTERGTAIEIEFA